MIRTPPGVARLSAAALAEIRTADALLGGVTNLEALARADEALARAAEAIKGLRPEVRALQGQERTRQRFEARARDAAEARNAAIMQARAGG